MTYRDAANALLEDFNQLSDDRKLSYQLAIFYIQASVDQIKYQHFKNRGLDSEAHLTIFEDISVSKKGDYSYFDLPSPVFDLPHNKGISFIAYQMDSSCDYLTKTFSRAKHSQLWILKKNPFTKPAPDRPLFTVAQRRVYLHGIDCIKVSSIIAGLFTTSDVSIVCDDSQQIDVAEQYIALVMREARNLASFGYAITPERANDGSDSVTRINDVAQTVEAAQRPQQQEQ